MSRFHGHPPIGIILAATCCLLPSGCQYAYPFEVLGVVKNAKDGKPIPGAKLYSLHITPTGEPHPGDNPIAVTGEDGSFTFVEEVRDVYFLHGEGKTDWTLFISQDGFNKESVSLRSVRKPANTGTRVPIFVVVYLLENAP